jgi:hypothetical protein
MYAVSTNRIPPGTRLNNSGRKIMNTRRIAAVVAGALLTMVSVSGPAMASQGGTYPVPQARAEHNGVWIKCEDYVTIDWNGDMSKDDWVGLYDHSPTYVDSKPDNNYLDSAYVHTFFGGWKEDYKTSYKNTNGKGYYVAYWAWINEQRRYVLTGSSGPTTCP